MTEQEYKDKRAEVLAKFTPEVILKYRHDGMFLTVIDALIHGKDPYDIIAILISGRMEVLNRLMECINSKPIQFIIDKP